MFAGAGGTLAADPSATADPSPGSEATPSVWLGGPFGTVPAGTLEEPATAAPDARPLDTWMRSAQLELTVEPPLQAAHELHAVATAEDGTKTELPLQDGHWLLAPDEPGLHVIAVTLETEGGTSEHAWLVDVPDREGSFETLLEMPAIEAEIQASTGSVSGERGHGCLVDMCQEVGYRPPVGVLPPLSVAVGEAVELHLSDGSAIVHWEGRLEPLPGTTAETRQTRATFDEPVASPLLSGLEPDAAGEWLLELRADYDRERGWQWYLFRIVAE
jgi:hypothetical protein